MFDVEQANKDLYNLYLAQGYEMEEKNCRVKT